MFDRKREYKMLNKMLDDAISGNFEETIYDERELSKLQSKLEHYLRTSSLSARKVQSEKENLKEILTNISHQTKTPLTNILLYAELLNEISCSDKAKAYSDEIILYARKLEMLINSLTKMSRLEIGVYQYKPKKVSLKDIVEQIVNMGRIKANEKNISIKIDDSLDAFALADKKWTIEATYNILDNAIKYSYSGADIDINIFQYQLFCGIKIKDYGDGLYEEEIPKIFARFYRGENVHDKEGIGVGLYLSREIINAQGGYIKVVSEKGSGSVFEIYLQSF